MVGNDAVSDRMDLLRGHDGAKMVDTLQEVVTSADAVVTMLPESEHVLEAYSTLLE